MIDKIENIERILYEIMNEGTFEKVFAHIGYSIADIDKKINEIIDYINNVETNYNERKK